jgi:DNA-binding transcriptional LysR family regulator
MAADAPDRPPVDGLPLNLRQLQYFSVIVEEGSFTRAAQRLMVSQPSLSHQLKALEASVGGALLERLPRGVVPTPMGRALLPRAQEALKAAAAARSDARRAGELDFAELHVSTTLTIAFGLLPELLRAWSADHPASHVTINEQKRDREVLADLQNGITDVALATAPMAGWDGPIEKLGFEEMVLVTSPDDPRGEDDDEVALADFAADSWVLPSTDCGLADAVAVACEAAGFSPHPAVRTLSSGTAVRLSAAGLGPSLVPVSAVSADRTAKVMRPRPLVGREVAVFGRPGAEHLVAGLAEKARAVGVHWLDTHPAARQGLGR